MTPKLSILVVFCVYIFISSFPTNASQQAILIGIDSYTDNKIPPLKFASSDAQGLARILSQNGYECRTLVDNEASKEMITEAFIQLEQRASQLARPDIFVFYFSGRGTRIPDDIQSDEILDKMDECLLPSDSIAGNELSYIRDDTLARWISAIKAKQTLIILDCSFMGNEDRQEIKGFAQFPVISKSDTIDLSDGLPENVMIVNSSSVDGFAVDGIYTPKLLEACSSEDADINNDRRISFDEANKYAIIHLQEQQTPSVTGNNAFDITLATLPTLSRLQLNSNPEGANITIYGNSQKLPLDIKTPVILSLKKGKYEIQAQKMGFIPSDTKQVNIDEYDKVYIPDAIQLNAIKVIIQINILDSKSRSIPMGNKIFDVQVAYLGKIIHEEKVPTDAKVIITPEKHSWLKIDDEYEVTLIGQSVLSSKPVSFTYNGYSDIQVNVDATIDDIPPILLEATFEQSKLVLGDEIRGVIKASDDGTGLDDDIEIQLQAPDRQTLVSIEPSNTTFLEPNIYKFKYRIPDDRSAIGDWKLFSATFKDKANNQAIINEKTINAGFTVFENHYTLGRDYFDDHEYENAISHFKRYDPQDDDTLYMTALAYYYQDKPEQALAIFQTIKDPTTYLGNERKNISKMPRTMVNKLWGRLLKDLKEHRKDIGYLNLLVVTAQELGRGYDEKVYRDYISKLRKEY